MKYITPELEMIVVETADIVLASGAIEPNPGDKGELPEDEF